MTKRIAIQFFGHLRTFDKTYESFYENVIKPNEESGYIVDVFMHAWDELEYSAWQWHNAAVPEARGAKLTEEQIKFVKDNYKPVKWEYTPQLQTDDKSEFDEFTGSKYSYSNILNVYYTKYRVNQLRLEYEKEQNIVYDYVLNTRADVFYKSKFVIDKMLDVYDNLLKPFETPENKLFYSGNYRDLLILDEQLLAASDVIYFGKPEVINKVSLIYENLNKDELKENFRGWENYLIYTAHKNNIKPVQVNYKCPYKQSDIKYSDWYISRLKDFKEQCPNEKPKKNLFSFRIGKKVTQLVIFGIYFKFETGVINEIR